MSVGEKIVGGARSLRLLHLDVHLGRAQQEHTRSDTFDGTAHPEHHTCRKVHDAVGHGLGHTGQVQHHRNAVTDGTANQLSVFFG